MSIGEAGGVEEIVEEELPQVTAVAVSIAEFLFCLAVIDMAGWSPLLTSRSRRRSASCQRRHNLDARADYAGALSVPLPPSPPQNANGTP